MVSRTAQDGQEIRPANAIDLPCGDALPQRHHSLAAFVVDVDFVFAGEPAQGQQHQVTRLAGLLDQLGRAQRAVLREDLPHRTGHLADA